MEALGLKRKFDFERPRRELAAAVGPLAMDRDAGGNADAFFRRGAAVRGAAGAFGFAGAGRFVQLGCPFQDVELSVACPGVENGGDAGGGFAQRARPCRKRLAGEYFLAARGTLFTPAHEAGCRCGVVRAFVLNARKVETGQFPLSDLLEADEIFLTNSMKGIVSVNALPCCALVGLLDREQASWQADEEAIVVQLEVQP